MSSNKYLITVNKKSLAPVSDQSLTLTYTAGDLCDFEGSKVDQLVRHVVLDNCQQDINADKSKGLKAEDVEIYIEGELIEKGKSKTSGTIYGSDKFCKVPLFVETIVTIDASAFFKEIEGLTLCDLDLSQYDHVFDKETIEQGWTFDYDDPVQNFWGYHLIKRKCWTKNPLSQSIGTVTQATPAGSDTQITIFTSEILEVGQQIVINGQTYDVISANGANTIIVEGAMTAENGDEVFIGAQQVVCYEDFSPFISIRALLEKALCFTKTKPGYEICSKLLELDEVKNLILPICMKPYGREYSEANHNLIAGPGVDDEYFILSGFTGFVPIAWDEQQDNGNNFDGTEYCIEEAGCFEICFSFDANLLAGNPEIEGVIEIGGSVVFSTGVQLGFGNFSGCYTFEAQAFDIGKKIRIGFFQQNPPGVNSAIEIRPLLLTVDYTHKFLMGSNVVWSELCKNNNHSITKIILGLAHMYGLYVCADNCNKKVTFEPFSSYYNYELNETCEGMYKGCRDLTPKVDMDNLGVSRPFHDIQECQSLTYKDDSNDETVGSLEEDQPLQKGKYTFPEGTKATGENNKSNPFFAKTIHIRDFSISAANPLTNKYIPVQLPLIFNDNYTVNPNSCKEQENCECPRVLYWAGLRPEVDGCINIKVGPGIAISPFPMSFSVNYNPTRPNTDPNLSYANEDGQPGLLERWHLQKMAIYRKGCSYKDIFDMDFVKHKSTLFKSKYYFCGKKFVPTSMTVNPELCQKVSVEMIEWVYPDQDDCDNISTDSGKSLVIYGG